MPDFGRRIGERRGDVDVNPGAISACNQDGGDVVEIALMQNGAHPSQFQSSI
jgi:hypothetical protein